MGRDAYDPIRAVSRSSAEANPSSAMENSTCLPVSLAGALTEIALAFLRAATVSSSKLSGTRQPAGRQVE